METGYIVQNPMLFMEVSFPPHSYQGCAGNKRICGGPLCQVCNTKLESIIHMLRDYPYVKCFWENIQAFFHIPNFYNMDLCSWLK